MEWPDSSEVEALLHRGGLTGAEMEALGDYVSTSVYDWQIEHSNSLYYAEIDEENVDTEYPDYADHFPAAALARRVNQILQNHRQ